MTVMIGIDPHKATHTAVAIDGDERPLARLRLTADRVQTGRLLAWAAPLGDDRTWAVESAGGLGKLVAPPSRSLDTASRALQARRGSPGAEGVPMASLRRWMVGCCAAAV